VQLQRKLQDEYNMLRSHDREARRASYPVLFTPKNFLDPAAQEAYRRRMPFSIIEIDNPDEAKKYVHETNQLNYDPKLYRTDACLNDMQAMAGIPLTVTGAGDGGDTATASALAKEGMETGVARRRVLVNRVITDILQWMAEVSMKVFSDDYMKEAYGPMAVFPRLTVDEMYTNLHIEVKGGLNGKPQAKDQLDLMLNFAMVAKNLGIPVNGPEVLKDLLDALGIRKDYRRYINPLAMGMVAPPGDPMGGGAPAMPPQGATPEGGAPPMSEREGGAPDNVNQIPNHPGKQMPELPPGMH
jgi:hypothetical protein